MALMTRKESSLAEAFTLFNSKKMSAEKIQSMGKALAQRYPERVMRYAEMDVAIEPGSKDLWDAMIRVAEKEIRARENEERLTS